MPTINVSDKLWKFLNDMKAKSNETFEDVIWRLVKDDEHYKQAYILRNDDAKDYSKRISELEDKECQSP